jgi:hypothetical protein
VYFNIPPGKIKNSTSKKRKCCILSHDAFSVQLSPRNFEIHPWYWTQAEGHFLYLTRYSQNFPTKTRGCKARNRKDRLLLCSTERISGGFWNELQTPPWDRLSSLDCRKYDFDLRVEPIQQILLITRWPPFHFVLFMRESWFLLSDSRAAVVLLLEAGPGLEDIHGLLQGLHMP